MYLIDFLYSLSVFFMSAGVICGVIWIALHMIWIDPCRDEIRENLSARLSAVFNTQNLDTADSEFRLILLYLDSNGLRRAFPGYYATLHGWWQYLRQNKQNGNPRYKQVCMLLLKDKMRAMDELIPSRLLTHHVRAANGLATLCGIVAVSCVLIGATCVAIQIAEMALQGYLYAKYH